jgi:hypothetical protein
MERAADEPEGGGEAVSRAHLLDEPFEGAVPEAHEAAHAVHEAAHEEPAARAPAGSAGHEPTAPTG